MNTPTVQTVINNPRFEELEMKEQDILEAMGYAGLDAPGYIKPLVYKYIAEAAAKVEITCGYVLFSNHDVGVEKKCITCKNVNFDVDDVIGIHLRGATELAIFVATIGDEFDDWIGDLSEETDQLTVFIVDTIGSELAEAAGDWLEKTLAKNFSSAQKKISNRLSPGYCNWDVSDQHKLFSLLPENFCGIKLNKSAMMIPRKSISGIIGIGENVKRLDYQCNICDMENCYKPR